MRKIPLRFAAGFLMGNGQWTMGNGQWTIVVSAEPTDCRGGVSPPAGGCGHPPLQNWFYIVQEIATSSKHKIQCYISCKQEIPPVSWLLLFPTKAICFCGVPKAGFAMTRLGCGSLPSSKWMPWFTSQVGNELPVGACRPYYANSGVMVSTVSLRRERSAAKAIRWFSTETLMSAARKP